MQAVNHLKITILSVTSHTYLLRLSSLKVGVRGSAFSSDEDPILGLLMRYSLSIDLIIIINNIYIFVETCYNRAESARLSSVTILLFERIILIRA